MSDATPESEPAYHLLLEPREASVACSALRLLIADEAHEPVIRRLARDVIAQLELEPDERGLVTAALSPAQMKITFSAVRGLFKDLQREQADEIDILRGILEKLPDEHTMRAIEL